MNLEKITRILTFAGIQASDFKSSSLSLTTWLKAVVLEKSPGLLGGEGLFLEVTQWLSFSWALHLSTNDEAAIMLKNLNSHLLLRSYLVGCDLTIGDIAVYDSVLLRLADIWNIKEYTDINRWLNHVHALVKSDNSIRLIESIIQTILPSNESLTLVSKHVEQPVKESKAVPTPTNKVDEKKATSTENKDVVPNSKKEGSDEPKKKADKKSESAKESKETKEVKPAAPEGSAGAAESPSLLDIRVGLVVRAWDHPESEKLVCEEIDLGEPSGPRQIASGIRAFYSSAEVQGRLVVVLCNLKERALAGFKSQGMVLAASNTDHSVVRLLEAPADAKPGDRICLGGTTGDPATPAQMAKKKIWEKLSVELRTDASGVVCFKSVPITVGDKLVKADLPDAAVG